MYIYAQILQKGAFLFPNRSPMWFNNKNERYFCEYLSKILVPAIGFEPIRSRELRILRLIYEGYTTIYCVYIAL